MNAIRFKFEEGEKVLIYSKGYDGSIATIQTLDIDREGSPRYYLKSYSEVFYEYELQKLREPLSSEEWELIDKYAIAAIKDSEGSVFKVAERAYKIAFAMLAERKRIKSQFKS